MGAIVWITGLCGSGKTTIASGLDEMFRRDNIPSCVIDGDELRSRLNSDLGFSPEDRTENIRRATVMAIGMARSGRLVCVALVSPCKSDRQKARETVLASGLRFIEVFLDCPLAICEARDPKGLYRKARAGEISGFTGIDAPYEVPENPEIVICTGSELPGESISTLAAFVGVKLGLSSEEEKCGAPHRMLTPSGDSTVSAR